jgi:hypothetical protein
MTVRVFRVTSAGFAVVRIAAPTHQQAATTAARLFFRAPLANRVTGDLGGMGVFRTPAGRIFHVMETPR